MSISKKDWALIAGIFSALNALELNCDWCLSSEEEALLAESFYINLKSNKLPKSKKSIKRLFECACVNTWGIEHQCKEPSDNEMFVLMTSIEDYYEDTDVYIYLEDMGIRYSGSPITKNV